MPEGGKEPVWIVSLVNVSGVSVGEVQIGAKSGSVHRKAWTENKGISSNEKTVQRVSKKSAPAKSETRNSQNRGTKRQQQAGDQEDAAICY